MAHYKQCDCKGKLQGKCDHPWWGTFKGIRKPLAKILRRPVDAHSVSDAKQAFVDYQKMVYAGLEATPAVPLAETSFDELLDDYLVDHVAAKGRNYREEQYKIDALRARFKGRTAASIALPDADKLVQDLRRMDRPRSAATQHRWVARLRHILNWGRSHSKFKGEPIEWSALDLPSEPKGRTRRPSPEEEEKIYLASPEWLRELIIAALDTGLRQNVLVNLQLKMVETAVGPKGDEIQVLRIPRSLLKNKHKTEDLVIPLTQRLRQLIEMKRLPPEGYLFGQADGEKRPWNKKVWWAALATAGIPRDPSGRGWSLKFHDLRGEFASSLHEAGVDTKTIQDMLDHSSSAMTDRYIRVKVRKTSDAIDRLEAARRKPAPSSDAGLPDAPRSRTH
jgi:integrase